MVTHKLKFHPGFVQGLEDAISYYGAQSKKAGRSFRVATKKQLNLIRKNPYSKSVRYDDVRFACIEKFPYSIHYSIDIQSGFVLVHRILCDHQDPDINWTKLM